MYLSTSRDMCNHVYVTVSAKIDHLGYTLNSCYVSSKFNYCIMLVSDRACKARVLIASESATCSGLLPIQGDIVFIL